VRQQRRELLLEIDEHAGVEYADDVVSQALLQAGLLVLLRAGLPIRTPTRCADTASIGAGRGVRIGWWRLACI
jgi:hypothetical protein